jgi:hypothetical protein
LHWSSRQTFLDINPPASDFDKAAGVGQSLTVALSESPLQVGRLDACASGISKNRRRRVLLIVAPTMRPVRQSVVVADQVAMKFDRLFNTTASFPVIFAESSLNPELALDQILPGVSLLVHVMANAEPLIVT